jgi:hypothetical protein
MMREYLVGDLRACLPFIVRIDECRNHAASEPYGAGPPDDGGLGVLTFERIVLVTALEPWASSLAEPILQSCVKRSRSGGLGNMTWKMVKGSNNCPGIPGRISGAHGRAGRVGLEWTGRWHAMAPAGELHSLGAVRPHG